MCDRYKELRQYVGVADAIFIMCSEWLRKFVSKMNLRIMRLKKFKNRKKKKNFSTINFAKHYVRHWSQEGES